MRHADRASIVRWRTERRDATAACATARSPASLTGIADDAAGTTEHEVRLTGLAPDTTLLLLGRHRRRRRSPAATPTTSSSTAPAAGTPRRRASGCSATRAPPTPTPRAVRDAYSAFTGTRATDLWLMLGDNAYEHGTDAEYQAAVFDMYPTMLRQSVLWPTLGNHDGAVAELVDREPARTTTSSPCRRTARRAACASGTEAYYSFDYGNIHFICLDSFETDRSPTGPMLTWLRTISRPTTQDWIDRLLAPPALQQGLAQLRHRDRAASRCAQNALPILEAGGVDLVLTGHSHSYERRSCSTATTALSGTLTASDEDRRRQRPRGRRRRLQKPTAVPAPHEGAVYAVAGQLGQDQRRHARTTRRCSSRSNMLGSMVLDVDGDRLDAALPRQHGRVARLLHDRQERRSTSRRRCGRTAHRPGRWPPGRPRRPSA